MTNNKSVAAQKTKILIVDDDRGFLETLKSVLELKGYEVVAAFSGHEALATARESGFDYLLMDIRMPGINGVDTWLEPKKILPDTPAIFMTAYSASELVQKAKDNGALEVFAKPLEMEKLLTLLENSPHRSLLLVEDNLSLSKSLKTFLESKSYDVALARTAGEAIRMFEKDPSRSVILDMKLDGDYTGMDVLIAIKELNPAVLVILMTGYLNEMSELVEKAISRKAYTCLYKPFDPEELIQILEDVRKNKDE